MKELFPAHWEELALDRQKFPMDVHYDRYVHFETADALLVVTARADGKLVGYYVGMILPHLHYQSSGNMLHTDLYYLQKEFRTGNGAKMLMCVQDAARRRKCVKMYLSTKAHLDHSKLFEAMGFRLSDHMFVKLL
jgi:hypothetical protein